VIVNNQYAYSTPITLQYACEQLSDRAKGYGMHGETVDGTDVIEVFARSKCAIERGMAGEGPTLLECKTMRLRGHSEHDDFKYVPPGLLDAWKNWDPLTRVFDHVKEQNVMNAGDLERLQSEIDTEIESAIQIAESEPFTKAAEAGKNVFRYWDESWTVPQS
jgi:TPP-dependent pyruvate/acetoin dehydrogenase alpha subunit